MLSLSARAINTFASAAVGRTAAAIASLSLCAAAGALETQPGNTTPGGGGPGGSNPPPLPHLFSVNAAADQLVSINPQNGAVTTIGNIGHNMIDVDLTWANGNLYAINNIFNVGTELIQLDPTSGAMISSTMITFGGNQVGLAEGLTNVNGALLASFRTDPGQPNRSNSLGALSLTGVLTNAVDYAPMTAIADMDGLAVNPLTLQVMGIDTDPFNGVIRSSLVGRDPASFTVLGQFNINPGGYIIGDLDFFNGQLYGIDDVTNRLHVLDPATGHRLGSINLTGGQSLQGLAAQAVPGPGPLALLGLAALLTQSRRRRV